MESILCYLYWVRLGCNTCQGVGWLVGWSWQVGGEQTVHVVIHFLFFIVHHVVKIYYCFEDFLFSTPLYLSLVLVVSLSVCLCVGIARRDRKRA